MRLPRTPLGLSTILAVPYLAEAINFNCKEVKVNKQLLDISPLGGPHSVHWIRELPPIVSNFTFTIDLCRPLKKTKHVPAADQCPNGTRVCGIKYDHNPADNLTLVSEVVPIAGEYANSNGRNLDPEIAPFKGSPSSHDADKDGFRLTLNGGRYPFQGGDKSMNQQAIVEFLCDKDKTGLEGDEPDSRDKEGGKSEDDARARDVQALENDEQDDEPDKSLRFVSYKEEHDNLKTLRLEWRTKYACPGEKRDDSPTGKSSHWGFFTWFIIVLFLAVAAYLILGSWLNYNRYGARGLDMLPHGDTIRDVPYLMKDWSRRVFNTVQGGGSRGGYSAV